MASWPYQKDIQNSAESWRTTGEKRPFIALTMEYESVQRHLKLSALKPRLSCAIRNHSIIKISLWLKKLLQHYVY